jgi:molybdenum cofactor biosynthesis enzyme MoaA
LRILQGAGVLWLQLTGGEPVIDRLFPEVYSLAFELGMTLTSLSNGSRLANPKSWSPSRTVQADTIGIRGGTGAMPGS